MGFWSVKILGNDLTCDVKDTYISYTKTMNVTNAYTLICKDFSDLFETSDEPLFWFALAEAQLIHGELIKEVGEKTLYWISRNGGSEYWSSNNVLLQKWLCELKQLEERICNNCISSYYDNLQEMEFIKNPWNTGDIYAFQFNSKKANSVGLLHKYIVIQKIGEIKDLEDDIVTVVQVYNKIFNILPTVDCVNQLELLPLVPYRKDGIYMPSLDDYMSAIMYISEPKDYPDKNFRYIGNDTNLINNCINYESKYNNEMSWYMMEDWLIDYYLEWNNTENNPK